MRINHYPFHKSYTAEAVKPLAVKRAGCPLFVVVLLVAGLATVTLHVLCVLLGIG